MPDPTPLGFLHPDDAPTPIDFSAVEMRLWAARLTQPLTLSLERQAYNALTFADRYTAPARSDPMPAEFPLWLSSTALRFLPSPNLGSDVYLLYNHYDNTIYNRQEDRWESRDTSDLTTNSHWFVRRFPTWLSLLCQGEINRPANSYEYPEPLFNYPDLLRLCHIHPTPDGSFVLLNPARTHMFSGISRTWQPCTNPELNLRHVWYNLTNLLSTLSDTTYSTRFLADTPTPPAPPLRVYRVQSTHTHYFIDETPNNNWIIYNDTRGATLTTTLDWVPHNHALSRFSYPTPERARDVLFAWHSRTATPGIALGPLDLVTPTPEPTPMPAPPIPWRDRCLIHDTTRPSTPSVYNRTPFIVFSPTLSHWSDGRQWISRSMAIREYVGYYPTPEDALASLDSHDPPPDADTLAPYLFHSSRPTSTSTPYVWVAPDNNGWYDQAGRYCTSQLLRIPLGLNGYFATPDNALTHPPRTSTAPAPTVASQIPPRAAPPRPAPVVPRPDDIQGGEPLDARSVSLVCRFASHLYAAIYKPVTPKPFGPIAKLLTEAENTIATLTSRFNTAYHNAIRPAPRPLGQPAVPVPPEVAYHKAMRTLYRYTGTPYTTPFTTFLQAQLTPFLRPTPYEVPTLPNHARFINGFLAMFRSSPHFTLTPPFGHRKFKGSLTFTTDPITLTTVDEDDEGEQPVELGRFSCTLSPDNLSSPLQCTHLKFIAEDPNECPDTSYIHPHISDERLCWGDAAVPANACIANGDLHTLFDIISSLLSSYNPGSPYCSLYRWVKPESDDSVVCPNCGDRFDNSDPFMTTEDGDEGCENCISHCEDTDTYEYSNNIYNCAECGTTTLTEHPVPGRRHYYHCSECHESANSDDEDEAAEGAEPTRTEEHYRYHTDGTREVLRIEQAADGLWNVHNWERSHYLGHGTADSNIIVWHPYAGDERRHLAGVEDTREEAVTAAAFAPLSPHPTSATTQAATSAADEPLRTEYVTRYYSPSMAATLCLDQAHDSKWSVHTASRDHYLTPSGTSPSVWRPYFEGAERHSVGLFDTLAQAHAAALASPLHPHYAQSAEAAEGSPPPPGETGPQATYRVHTANGDVLIEQARSGNWNIHTITRSHWWDGEGWIPYGEGSTAQHLGGSWRNEAVARDLAQTVTPPPNPSDPASEQVVAAVTALNVLTPQQTAQLIQLDSLRDFLDPPPQPDNVDPLQPLDVPASELVAPAQRVRYE